MGASVWKVGRTAEEGQRDLERRMWRTGWGANVWRVGRTAEEGQRDLERRMWRTGWGLVSGEWDEQQRKAKEILREGCGGLDGG